MLSSQGAHAATTGLVRHVAAIVQSNGFITYVPAQIPTGTVEVALVDNRTNKSGSLNLQSFSPDFPLNITGVGNSQITQVRSNGDYQLMARVTPDGVNGCCYIGVLHVEPVVTVPHVDAAVQSNGFITYSPSAIGVGDVEVTLVDGRTNKSGSLELQSFAPDFPLDIVGAGNTLVTHVSSPADYQLMARVTPWASTAAATSVRCTS